MNSSSCRSVKSSVKKCTVSSSFLIRLFSCSTSFAIVFLHITGFTKGAIIVNVTTGHRFPTILTMPYRLVMCSENGLVHWLLSILFAIEEFHLQTAFPLGCCFLPCSHSQSFNLSAYLEYTYSRRKDFITLALSPSS